MTLARNKDGPLKTATLHQADDVIFWGLTDPVDIDPRDTDIPYVVKIGDRLDLLAARYLANEQLGWVILHRNNLRLVPNDLVPGRTIFIPTVQTLTDRGII